MDKQQAITEARRLSNDCHVKWCVVDRGSHFVCKIINPLNVGLNGHKLGIDYQTSQIVWSPSQF